MSRFHQRLRQRLRNPEFAAAYWEMDSELQLMQAIEDMRKQLQLTQDEFAKRMGTQREAVTRLLNAEHPNPKLETLTKMFAALGVTAEVHLRRAHEGEAPLTINVDVSDKIPA
ncbi:MAG: helix-turn-helix domain-containing protein [Ktedonobacterales bacterium]